MFALRMASKRGREGGRIDILGMIFDILHRKRAGKKKREKSSHLSGASDVIPLFNYDHGPPFSFVKHALGLVAVVCWL